MTEVDIWIKVFDKLEFVFIDEHCRPGLNNLLKYQGVDNIYSLYFNRKTGKVILLNWTKNPGFISKDEELKVTTNFTTSVNKQLFYEHYKSLFRDIKLESLT